MFKIVVVVFKRRFGVIGRIDINALHLSCVERQQGLERFKIIALNQHIARIRRTNGKPGDFFKQTVWDSLCCSDVFVSRQPIQNWHIR